SNKATKKALISEDEATYNQSLMPPNDDFVNDVHQQISCILMNTKRKHDTTSGNSAIAIYTPDEHLYIQNKQQSNKRVACKHNYSLGVGFNNVKNDPIQAAVNENWQ
ncbi:hypothetical protein Tco_1451662, partial [Tanacetum coccineum]